MTEFAEFVYDVLETGEPPAELEEAKAALRVADFAERDGWGPMTVFHEALDALRTRGRFARASDDGESRIVVVRQPRWWST